jgi:hypothetical protein
MQLTQCVLATALISAGALIFSGCASQHGSREHQHAHSEHSTTQHSATVEIPDHPREIFAETQKHLSGLAAAIAAKDPRGVHQHAEAARTTIAKIGERSTTDTKVEVDRLAKEVTAAAGSAHRAAHDDDWSKAKSDVKSAQDSLRDLQARFKENSH